MVFLIVRQNSSQADIGLDIYSKPYPVPFGDWVLVYLSAVHNDSVHGNHYVTAGMEAIEGKIRFRISGSYNINTETGREWYRKTFPKIKEDIRIQCGIGAAEGYPISLNDFEFDITAY